MVVPAAADIERRLTRLTQRDDAGHFAGETREIREQVAQGLLLGEQAGGGWLQADSVIRSARTWLIRLECDLKRMDASRQEAREPLASTQEAPAPDRMAAAQRAFRCARFMATDRCPPDEAMAMTLRAEQALAADCPHTSALINERVRRALGEYPDAVVDPLVRMLRMGGDATLHDALAVLRVMTRLPADMPHRLADAGVTIHPSPGGLGSALPTLRGTAGDSCKGLFCKTSRRVVVRTRRDPATGTRVCCPRTPLHEMAHAYDRLLGCVTHEDADFVAARQSDLDAAHIAAGRDDYFRETDRLLNTHPGSETFAESFAMYLRGDQRWPALHAYWDLQFKTGRILRAPAAHDGQT
jgi:hypothetical protein